MIPEKCRCQLNPQLYVIHYMYHKYHIIYIHWLLVSSFHKKLWTWLIIGDGMIVAYT